MHLPNLEVAFVAEAKIVRYLLDLSSEHGRPKARFFLSFGFTIEAWGIMADAIKQHAGEHAVTKIEQRPFGVHYVIEGSLKTPDGRNPLVRVIWIVDEGSNMPRLLSAYPI